MHKIAIIVEGLTESIFVEKLIIKMFREFYPLIVTTNIQRAKNITEINIENAQLNIGCYVLIYIAENYNKVISVINEYKESMINEKGYSKIIGLRDVDIPRSEIENIKNIWDEIFQGFPISICLEIMSIEAWFLADKYLFEKLNRELTIEYIKENSVTNIDLTNNDPENYEKPIEVINSICELIGR